MDFNKMRELAQSVSNELPTSNLEDIFFMVRAMSQAVEVVKATDTDDLEALEICCDLLEGFVREINDRTINRSVKVVDGNIIKNTLTNLRPLSKDVLLSLHGICEQIYHSTTDRYSKVTMKSGAEMIEVEMMKRGVSFSPLGTIKYSVLDVPTPEEIINGKSPKGIPNT